jgi:hypothetical protein
MIIFIASAIIVGVPLGLLIRSARANVGTRSVLYGYHCFLIHWLFVARGWWGLYRFRRIRIGTRWKYTQASPRRSVTLLDGTTVIEESEYQQSMRMGWVLVKRGVFTSLLDPRLWLAFIIHDWGYWGKPNMDGAEGELHPYWAGNVMGWLFSEPWDSFTKYHSRFLAKNEHQQPSPLCWADKMAIVHMPSWLYLLVIHATGEVHEYMAKASVMIEAGGHKDSRAWLRDVKKYANEIAQKYKDGAIDETTPDTRKARSTIGVWE